MLPLDTPTLTDSQTLTLTRALIQAHLPVEANGYRCTTETLTDALLAVAARGETLEAVCQDLQEMPTSQTLRSYFNKHLTPEALDLVELRINAMLEQAIPAALAQRLRDQAHDVAIDLHDQPYYGTGEPEEALFVRSKAKAGTTRFHRVATAYLVRGGTRLTLAVCFVRPKQSTREILQRLVARLEALQVAIRHLLLDKGFCSIAVIEYLQQSPYSAIIACPVRGKKAPDPGGTRALLQGRQSYRTQHTFRSGRSSVTAEIVVCRSRTTAQRTGRMARRMQWLLYVVVACRLVPKKVRRLYRRRFGIETSYRQTGDLRGWTSSRNVVYRFLLQGLAFVLLTVWVVLRYLTSQVPRRGGRRLAAGQFRLLRFTRFLQRALERHYGCCEAIVVLSPPLL